MIFIDLLSIDSLPSFVKSAGSGAYLRNFFPQTLVQKAIDAWPSSHLLQGTVATEAPLEVYVVEPWERGLSQRWW